MLLLYGLEGFGGRWTLIGALEVPDEYGTLLVLRVNGSFGQVDEPRSGCSRQYRMQKIGLYPIISAGSFYDGLINLNKFFRIVGAIILINVACLELSRPHDLPEWSCQSAELTSCCWCNVPY
jgi:hypothetical protein